MIQICLKIVDLHRRLTREKQGEMPQGWNAEEKSEIESYGLSS